MEDRKKEALAVFMALGIGLTGCSEENSAPKAMINDGNGSITLCQGATVVLDGSKSSDTDGKIAHYDWITPEGKKLKDKQKLEVQLANKGTFVYKLVVTDNEGATAATKVKITVNPPAEWTLLNGTKTSDTINGMSVDDGGNIVATGYTKNTGDSKDIFNVNVVKVSSSGSIIWSKDYNSSTHDMGYDTAIDSSGNIYVAGMTKGGFGDTNASCGTDRYPDPFVIKLNSAGEMQWGRMICSDKAGLARGLRGQVNVIG